jgi:hypothetical protein
MHQTADQAIIERIKLSRGTTEPSPEAPTENTEAVNVSEDAPIDEVIEPEAQADEDSTLEIEEPVSESAEIEIDEGDTDLLYYEIDGEEVSSKQLKEWKSDGLKQADYTRKTQALADDVKSLDAKQAAFDKKVSEFDGKMETLKAMVSEESLTDEAIAELREYEPEEYIKYTEKLAKRKQFIDGNKSTKKEPSFDVEAERKKLWDNNPSWMQDGKQTKTFETDMKLIQNYAGANGYNNDDFAGFRAQDFQTMLMASKYAALNNKNAAIEKKVRRAPVSTKPRAAAKGADADYQKALKAFRSNPSDANAIALRKIKKN